MYMKFTELFYSTVNSAYCVSLFYVHNSEKENTGAVLAKTIST